MRIEQLVYAVTVARHGSFRRAAEELHISQPALSTAIRNLERELGAVLFDRGRGGARVSPVGADLLPHVTSVVAAYDSLRRAADDRHRDGTIVRIGTVNAGTVPIVTPTAAAFQRSHPSVRLEVVSAREAEIDQGLHEGRFDLGLITCLAGDDMPPDLETVPLVRGRIVVCLRVDSPLAERDAVTIEELAAEPQILMRPGFLMHRVVHRLLDGRSPAASYLTDGGDMGKLMVAEGVGVMVVPDFSIIGDPLEVAGLVTWRPLTGVDHEVQLAVRRRRSDAHPKAVRELRRMLLERAATYETAAAAADAA